MNNKESMNLKNYWNDEKKVKKIEKNSPKEEIKREDNKQISMNFDEENKSSMLGIIAVIAILVTVLLYFYIQEEKQNEIDAYNKAVIEYNKSVIEQQKRNSKNSYVNKNYNNSKYFKIKHETIENNYDYSFMYNISVIENQLNNVVSRENDNNYQIEIVGNISAYGNLFYKIYKIKNSSEYDNEFNQILEEVKKIKFKKQSEDVDFKIFIHNNSYDLN
jgi:hypothetical protein